MSNKFILPKNMLRTSDILHLANLMEIPNFAGVKMRDELKGKPKRSECGIENLNITSEPGSYWICFYWCRNDPYFFYSFAEPSPRELLKFLESDVEFTQNFPVIKRNLLIVQHVQSSVCGPLCLYVLKQLSLKTPFSDIIDFLDKRYRKLPTTPLVSV